MATTFFEASQAACQEITKTFDMVWALDAGLWNLRQAATEFFSNNADANNKDAKDAIVNGLYVHGFGDVWIKFEPCRVWLYMGTRRGIHI